MLLRLHQHDAHTPVAATLSNAPSNRHPQPSTASCLLGTSRLKTRERLKYRLGVEFIGVAHAIPDMMNGSRPRSASLKMREEGPSVVAMRDATRPALSDLQQRLAPHHAYPLKHRRISALLLSRKRVSVKDVEAAQPFTWTRCFISLFSYALLLSDVVRSGFGIQKSTMQQFPQPEPDSILHFGPFAYRILHLPVANLSTSDASTTNVWTYKFDTTSVSMRSIALYLKSPKWLPCLHYQGECEGGGLLSKQSVFDMIDSLIGSVSMYRPTKNTQGHVTVRSDYEWVDRLHHFAFPWFFQRTVKRTTQAIHYRLDSTIAVPSICARRSGPRPYACEDTWTKYSRLCDPSVNSYCADVTETIWSHIEHRMAGLLSSYANHTLEFLLIEGADDYTRPGLTFQGRKLFDVVTMVRILDCRSISPECVTVAVEDFRYEAARMTINAADWFGIIGLIRSLGQVYAWIRLISLVFGTFCALQSSQGHRSSTWELFIASLRIFFIIPSQVVIYGSVFPILCYLLAHLLDSCAVYELVALQFNSTLGHFEFDLKTFVTLCAVSMRSIWVLAFVCHVVLAVYSTRSWSPTHGLPGIPEFSVSLVASLTIFAQVRSTAWRSTRIHDVFEVTPSARRHRWQTMSHAIPRTPLNKLFFGSTIDAQCILASLTLFLGLLALSRLASVVYPRLVGYRLALVSRTLVPYSAGLLWMTNGLVVSWNGAFLVRIPVAAERPVSQSRTASLLRAIPFRRLSRVQDFPWKTRSASIVELTITDTEVSLQLQRDMQNAIKRSREVDAMVFIVNLAVMTDPVIFCRLRALRGYLVGLYKSKSTDRRFLLPHGVGGASGDIPVNFADLDLVLVLNSKDLLWCELLQCG